MHAGITSFDIAHRRLHNQHIAGARLKQASDVVGWLGAVQAQDYLGALWAVGLRMERAVEADIEQALADRTIIRTWPMRGTLHIVAAEDVRWMLELLTPRVIARTAGRYRQLDLEDAVFGRSAELFVDALHGGKQLSRNAMYQVLEAEGIATAGQRGIHILGKLAQDGLICFGARQGKQPTFALLEEWAPRAQRLEREAALAELARRYFTGHGPAMVQDLMWWSGLPAADARAGLKMVKTELSQETIDGRTYWTSAAAPLVEDSSPEVYLLPGFDEYLLGYKDRGAILSPADIQRVQPGSNGIFSPTIVSRGRVVGTWKRVVKKDRVVVTPQPFTSLTGTETDALAAAANRYGSFLDLPVVLS